MTPDPPRPLPPRSLDEAANENGRGLPRGRSRRALPCLYRGVMRNGPNGWSSGFVLPITWPVPGTSTHRE